MAISQTTAERIVNYATIQRTTLRPVTLQPTRIAREQRPRPCGYQPYLSPDTRSKTPPRSRRTSHRVDNFDFACFQRDSDKAPASSSHLYLLAPATGLTDLRTTLGLAALDALF
ncbi:hypothetical protein E4U57_004570 [Claviceps arundinis]|nr:hypothetical protein E4U57_004570 [Claviceps arundinis]